MSILSPVSRWGTLSLWYHQGTLSSVRVCVCVGGGGHVTVFFFAGPSLYEQKVEV